MQAIHTKYFGPTDFKGSRIKAACQTKSITVPYDHALDSEEMHRSAAVKLCRKLGWHFKDLATGQLPDGSYCHVLMY